MIFRLFGYLTDRTANRELIAAQICTSLLLIQEFFKCNLNWQLNQQVIGSLPTNDAVMNNLDSAIVCGTDGVKRPESGFNICCVSSLNGSELVTRFLVGGKFSKFESIVFDFGVLSKFTTSSVFEKLLLFSQLINLWHPMAADLFSSRMLFPIVGSRYLLPPCGPMMYKKSQSESEKLQCAKHAEQFENIWYIPGIDYNSETISDTDAIEALNNLIRSIDPWEELLQHRQV